MSAEETTLELVAAIDTEQARLRELVSGKDEAALAAQPPNGKWSVVENLRHLLFAEQLHLGRLVAGGQEFSPLGLPPTGMQGNRRTRPAGSVESPGIQDVLAEWTNAHSRIGQFAGADSPEARKALERNLQHLRTHLRIIERLLRTR